VPLSRRRTADRRPDRRHRGSSHSPSEPGGKRCSALAFLEPLLQPEVGLALCVHRHCSAAAREKFQKLPIEAGSGVAAIAGSASLKSSSTMREPVGQPPSSYREWPTDTADIREAKCSAVVRDPSWMQRPCWCSGSGSPESNRLAHHRLRSRDAGRFSMCRLPAMLRRYCRARRERAMQQPSKRPGRKDREPRTEPNSHRSDRHTPRRQIVHPSRPRRNDPDEAAHALFNELLAGRRTRRQGRAADRNASDFKVDANRSRSLGCARYPEPFIEVLRRSAGWRSSPASGRSGSSQACGGKS